MQIVHISTRFGEDLDQFFCPLTGEQILFEDAVQASPATVGIWYHEVPDDPELVKGDLANSWKQFLQDEEKLWDEGVDGFLASVESEDLVAFELTSFGIACGPVSSTFWVVLDMSWSPNENQE